MKSQKLAYALLLFAALAALFSLASQGVGVCWDETIYFASADNLRVWALKGMPFDHESLRQAWSENPYLNPHPPFMKVLSAITASLFPNSYPLGYRLGNILFNSAALTSAFLLLATEFSLLASFTGVLFVICQPRLFGEFLIATSDGPVALGWLLLALLTWQITRAPRKLP